MSETDEVVALWRLQSAYADVVTRRAWPELHDLFRPDAVVHVDTVTAPVFSCTGPQEVGEFISGAIERFDHFEFVILNSVVDITGPDSATGRIFMCEIRHEPGLPADKAWHTAYGRYEDDYVRVDNRWWFGGRRYRSMARTGPEPGVFGLPPTGADPA